MLLRKKRGVPVCGTPRGFQGIVSGETWERVRGIFLTGGATWLGNHIESAISAVQDAAEEGSGGVATQFVGPADPGVDILLGIGRPVGQTMM